MNRSGFTLIELAIVIVIIGILANIAIPATHDARRKAQAASAVVDVGVIRTAVIDYMADHENVPANSGWGAVPPELVGSLPSGFAFVEGDVSYRWQRFGNRRRQRTGQIGRIRIRAGDRVLANALRGAFLGRATGGGRNLTVIVE